MKRIRFCPVLLALVLVAACSPKQNEKKEEGEHIVTVDVAPVLSSPISLKVTTDALLYPIQPAAIVPKMSAPVKKFYVDRGAHVKAGQLLAELENRDLAAAVSENQASFEQAEANYQSVSKGTVPEEQQKAEADVRSAKDLVDAQQRVFDARQGLLKEGAISQKEVSDAQLALVQAKNQYDIATKHLQIQQSVSHEQEVKVAAAQRNAAKARLDSAQAQFDYSRITSPIDGVVTDRPVYAGETPASGSPLITVMDLSQIIAKSHVSLDDSKQIKVGDPANIFPTDGGAQIPGKVTVISPALDPSSTTVEVWVQAPNMGNRLTPGTSLRVEMIAQTVPAASVIPWAAVLTGVTGSTFVIVVTPDNKPQRKPVTLGIRDGANVQIKEGLNNGERVVTTGAFELAKLDEDVYAKTKLQIAPPKEQPEEPEQ
jgi:HlyD family secretion protein